MFSQDDDNQGVVLGVLFGVIALVIGLVIGLAVYKTGMQGSGRAAAAATVPAAPGAGAVAAAAVSDAASVAVEQGVVKFYFASGKAELPAGGPGALADIVAGIAAGKIASVSGFVDASGDPVKNAELAKQRAFAVRDLIYSLGVAQDKVVLKKPDDIKAEGAAAQARRVEVSLQ